MTVHFEEIINRFDLRPSTFWPIINFRETILRIIYPTPSRKLILPNPIFFTLSTFLIKQLILYPDFTQKSGMILFIQNMLHRYVESNVCKENKDDLSSALFTLISFILIWKSRCKEGARCVMFVLIWNLTLIFRSRTRFSISGMWRGLHWSCCKSDSIDRSIWWIKYVFKYFEPSFNNF